MQREKEAIEMLERLADSVSRWNGPFLAANPQVIESIYHFESDCLLFNTLRFILVDDASDKFRRIEEGLKKTVSGFGRLREAYEARSEPMLNPAILLGMRIANGARDLRYLAHSLKAPESADSAASGNGEKQARALAILALHPDWSDTKIARAAKVSRTALYRMESFTSARSILKSQRGDFPRATDTE